MQTNALHEKFRLVFEQHYNALCNYALTFVKSEEASEDIVQDTFIKVWEKRPDLIVSSDIRYYLFVAVRNNSISYLRKERKNPQVELNDYDAAEDQIVFAGEVYQETDYDALLAVALARLPPRCREVFVMSRMSKLTYQQIADSLGISVKTVENQMGTALKRLRAFMRHALYWWWPIIFFLINR
ncbi:RNA polymerase sigma-70 factor [Chitinophaga oryziterrae]|uniref:RNA polymerase sigma-70 factor n=1 Tax=Chitinophaga oryziterrae TaxID=1031224 RepID=UPI0012FB7F6C|nr:RNA polymerase sigma-70 factor [Chitinophaga oryziterrae]